MRSLSLRAEPIPTLYIKSMGKSCDQGDIRSIFEKARETAPCLLVLEDIDSLVSDHVRSFFLNEVDGLEGNDGIMMIGSTNYCRMILQHACDRLAILT
jgi:transitional endoplasmic reticulum ATPase